MSNNRFKFTRKRLETLPTPTKGWQYHYDTVVPSLAVGIGPTGVRTFVLVKKIAGVAERIKLERMSDSFGVDQARDAAKAQLEALAAGTNPADARRATRNGKTLRDVFGHFKEHRRNARGGFISPKTLQDYASVFKCHLGGLADRPMGSISNEQLRTLHSTIGRDRPTIANRVVIIVSSLFNHAIDRKLYAGVNPAARIRPFPEDSRERFLQRNEWPKFMDALSQTPYPFNFVFALAVFTGERIGKVLSAEWADVDLDERIWRVRNTKNGKTLTKYLSEEAAFVFSQVPRVGGSDFLFPSRLKSKTGHVMKYSDAWEAFLARAGMSDSNPETRLRVHDLRRTFGSWQASTGASLPIIGKSLGHSSSKATEVYARLSNDPVRESIERATRAMLSAANDGTPEIADAFRKLFGPDLVVGPKGTAPYTPGDADDPNVDVAAHKAKKQRRN